MRTFRVPPAYLQDISIGTTMHRRQAIWFRGRPSLVGISGTIGACVSDLAGFVKSNIPSQPLSACSKCRLARL